MVAADIENPVAEAGIRATGNGHPGGSRHHSMPTTTPARQILRTTIPKTREDVAAREKTAKQKLLIKLNIGLAFHTGVKGTSLNE